MRASKKANQEARKSQTIQIQPGWVIRRLDDLNWTTIWPKQKRPYFYGSLESALRDLPKKLLDQKAKNDLHDIHKELIGIHETITRLLIAP